MFLVSALDLSSHISTAREIFLSLRTSQHLLNWVSNQDGWTVRTSEANDLFLSGFNSRTKNLVYLSCLIIHDAPFKEVLLLLLFFLKCHLKYFLLPFLSVLIWVWKQKIRKKTIIPHIHKGIHKSLSKTEDALHAIKLSAKRFVFVPFQSLDRFNC